MTHFGIVCPAAAGHLNPMTTLGHELQRRGHKVTLFGLLDAQPKAAAAELGFCPLGESEYPTGAYSQALARERDLSGWTLLRYAVNQLKQEMTVTLRDAPGAMRKAGVEALLVDYDSPEGGTVAEYLEIPFISVCNALMQNQEQDVPPPSTLWLPNSAWWARLRNRVVYTLFYQTIRLLWKVIDEYRQQWELPLYYRYDDAFSKLAQVGTYPAEFDFPRTALPQCFHFTGPFYNPASREPTPFPFEKLTGQPLIYTSMGTLQNRHHLMAILHDIIKACVGLDAQLVISLGGLGSPESLPKPLCSTLVVRYAPQLEILQKATLTITHAGMNITMESLSNGVPMVAIPNNNQQPGVGVRLAWTGAGEVVPLSRLSVSRLRTAIEQVMTENFYKNNASRLQESIRQAGGVHRAADIVEQVISTGKPVYR